MIKGKINIFLKKIRELECIEKEMRSGDHKKFNDDFTTSLLSIILLIKFMFTKLIWNFGK